MTTIATLAVNLTASSKPFVDAMDQAENKTKSWSDNVSKNLKSIGKDMTDLGKKATVGLTLPIAGASLAAINYASDLSETKNKVEVVFGDMTKSVMDWSNNSATAMGLSQQQALEAAGTYGNLFLTLGLGQKPAADMSTSLVQLASDLASFNNANPEDVLQAIQSGIVGQVEPLRRFGVNLSEAAVQAKAMELGLADADGQISESAKVQARYALIMEQTTTAQGDFARTADGLANSQRIVSAQIKDAAAALGTQLLPYALQFVQWAREMLSRFQALNPEQQRMIIIIAGIAAAIGPVLVVVGSLVTALGAIIPVIAAVGGFLAGFALPILLIIGLIAILYLAWQNNWGGIRDTVANIWSQLQPIFQTLWNWLQVNIPLALQALAAFWSNTLLPAIQAVWSFLQTYVFPLVGALANVLIAILGKAIQAVAGIVINVLIPNLSKMWDWIELHILPTLQKFAAWLSEKVSPALRGIGDAIKGLIGWLNDLASKIANIHLPDWMTPGSPTPWEIGLRGVSSAMEQLSRKQLPTFNANLAFSGVPAFAGAGALPAVGVAPSGGAGAGGKDEAIALMLDELLRAIKDMPNDISRSNKALVEKFGGQRK